MTAAATELQSNALMYNIITTTSKTETKGKNIDILAEMRTVKTTITKSGTKKEKKLGVFILASATVNPIFNSSAHAGDNRIAMTITQRLVDLI